MLFFDAVRQGTNCVKSLCACACFLICGGPILVIVGIVILVAHNSREEDVKAYNEAVLAYDPAPVNTWVPATFNVATATAQDETNTIYGNQEGITTVGTSRVVRSTQVSASNSILFSMSNVASFTMSGISTTSTATTTMQCGIRNGCSYSSMDSRCRSDYGSSANYRGSGCTSSGSCGTCEYRTYLSEVCAVVTSEAPYQRGSLSSCFYPFTSGSHRYVENQPSYVKVTVRKADDPYIVLQRVTEGEEDFGLTKEQQHKIGAALLAVGIVLIVCMCVLVAAVFCMVRGGPASAQVAASPTIQMQVSPHSPQPLYPNSGQPAMGQPVAYSPTAGGGGYGQPQPQGGYGQPQQGGGYGAPPPLATNPAYGAQPQYATGYPPQGNSYDYNNNNNTAPAGYGVPQPAYPQAQQQQPYIQKL